MSERRKVVVAVALLAVLVASGCRPIGRVSIPHGGTKESPTSAASWSPTISGDGRLVAFASNSADLVAVDTNGSTDVFVRDLGPGTTTRVSVADGGGESAGVASEPVISADGRFVAFTSTGSDLVPGDTNGVADVFVRDLVAGTTTRVSVADGGGESAGVASEPAISADGRFVAFTSTGSDLVPGDTNGVADVFVRDLVAGSTTRVSTSAGGAQAAGASYGPSISASGDWVAFTSTAANLVSGDTNGVADVFVARRTGGTVRRASAPDPLTSPFGQANGASANAQVVDPIGGYTGSGDPLVAYESQATNLAGSDGNGSGSDVFVTTHLFGSVARTVRLSSGATEATNPTLGVIDGGPGFVVAYVRSGDFDRIVSVVRSSPLVADAPVVSTIDVTDQGGAPNGPSSQPAVTPDGRFVAFQSDAGNLAGRSAGPTAGDVYVGRSLSVRVDSVDPPRVGLGETRSLTVNGSGFQPNSRVSLGSGASVDDVQFVSSSRLIATVTVQSMPSGGSLLDLTVTCPGAGGSLWGRMDATCSACVEVAAVVEQPGPVAIQITGGTVQVGSVSVPLPGCTAGVCLALPADVTADGDLAFGLDSVALDPISIPVELIAGIETTIDLVPRLDAPAGTVVPATGQVELEFGLAVGLRNPLLPSACAIGPVRVDLSTGGSDAVPYDQATGDATLTGGFTEELAVSGCGLFTSVINGLIGLPMPIAENSVSLEVRFDPVLTGTATP